MNGLSTTLTLDPPCTECLHEPVCSIRRAIEGSPPIEIPLPDAAFSLRVVASVECNHFLPIKPAAKAKRQHAVSPEGRERMRQSALAVTERRRQAREAVAE